MNEPRDDKPADDQNDDGQPGSAGECPSPDRLWDYAEGTLEASDVEVISSHVNICPRCAAEVERLSEAIEHFAATHQQTVKDIILSKPPRAGAPRVAARVLMIAGLLVAGAAGGCGLAAAYEYYVSRHLREMYEPWRTDPAPAIVIGNAHVYLKEAPEVLTNRYIGVDDSVAAGRAFALLKDMRPKGARLDLFTSAELEAQPKKLEGVGAAFIIGGPAVNQQCTRAMQASNMRVQYVAPPDAAVENEFVRRAKPGEPVGLRDAAGRLHRYDPNAGDTCALVAYMRIGERRHTILAAGYDGRGTRLATEALTKPTNVVTQLLEQFRKTGRAALILTFDRNDSVVIQPFPAAADDTAP